MDKLIFLTDRFPYGKGEAFIENEIDYLSKRFDEVIIVPLGLTVDDREERQVPQNCTVMPPANTDDLYQKGRPGRYERIAWTVKYMLPWIARTFLCQEFYHELYRLFRKREITKRKIYQLVRTMSPAIRNRKWIKENLQISFEHCSVYVYSYWLNYILIQIFDVFPIRDRTKRIICRAHRHDLFEEFRSSHYIPFHEKMIEAADDICFISKDGYNYLARKYPSYLSKYHINYLGTRDYGEGRWEHDSVFHIVSCSYVVPKKRVDRIASSLSLISDCRIHWTHLGGGQDLEQLKDQAKTLLGQKNNISHDLKGHITNAEVMRFYQDRQINLFVNVSSSEGLPVSIMEASSFGIPVIATDVGGSSEAFADGKSGYLLPKEFTDKELAELVKKVYFMPKEHYTEMRRMARQYWRTHFFADINYESFVKFFFPKNQNDPE